MKELGRTNDPVKISDNRNLLSEEGIEVFIMDEHSGMMLHGMYGVMPRVLVIDDDFEAAIGILSGAGITL
jgi:hypothetical protein